MTHSVSSSIQKASSRIKNFLSRYPFWVLLPFAVVPVLIVSVIALLLLLPDNNGFVQYKQNIEVINRSDGLHVVVGKKVLDDTIDAPYFDQHYSSLDGKSSAFLTHDRTPSCNLNDISSKIKKSLYVVDGTRLTKVADDVFIYQFSNSGEGLVYSVYKEDEYSLYHYSVKKQRTSKIADRIGDIQFHISPDGKSVAYLGTDGALMFFDGKESRTITTDDTYPLGLSNNGKYIYAIRSEDDGKNGLYSYNSRGKATYLGNANRKVKFNSTHTQIMFYGNDGTYISSNGKEGVKVSNCKLYLVTAPNSQSTGHSYFHSITYPITNLYDHVYTGSDGETTGAWLIRKYFSKDIKLAGNVQNCQLDESGKYMYFTCNDGELRVLKISHKEDAFDKSKKLANHCDGYLVTSNRSLVYFMDGNALYSVNGKHGGISYLVKEHVSNPYSLTISSGDVVYFMSDDAVYTCILGFRCGIELFDADYINTSPNGIVYASNDDEFYATANGWTLKKIFDPSGSN